MFHSLILNYKMLISSDNKCIYSAYKMYVEKYWKIKRLLYDAKVENKQMKQQITRLQIQLNDILSKQQNNTECIIDIHDYDEGSLSDENDCESCVSEDKFELV